MAEWLSHVLFAYAAGTILSWVVTEIDTRWVTVAMIGSILPDFNRLDLLLPAEVITALVGSDFAWTGIHTLAGVILLAGIGALLFVRAHPHAFIALLGGALSHLLIDLPQRYADGHMLLSTYAFPIPVGRPPTPGWYVTSDPWVAVLAILTAIIVFILNHYRNQTDSA